jgi:hypothetical protein
VGAPESNAGDDFHFWWAASRALELIEPATDLRLLTLEGLASVDDPDEAYETVDVGQYFGGTNIEAASALVLSQLKYSTRDPDRRWTAARLCEKRRRGRPGGSTSPARSVVADLAAAYRQLLDDHGPAVPAKAKIALVSNQPGDHVLLDSVAAAADWVRAQATPAQRGALLKALPADHAGVIRRLSEAIGPRLSNGAFCDFLAALDFSQTGALDRATLARAVRVGAQELTPGRAPDSARRLFHLVREQAMPGAHAGLTADDVLAELGAPELLDLYPAPPRLPDVSDPLPAPGARAVAEAVLGNLGRLVVGHGPAGAGKTTALRQVENHLPDGSVLVLFDSYGGGDYLSSGEERHTPQRFATQVINELAQRCGTPLLIQPPLVEDDLWRRVSRTLERAASTLAPDAVLVIAVDAADNAAIAAAERGDRGFLPGLVRLPLPERVMLVLTARSHRVPLLGADPAATVALAPLDAATSGVHLRRYRPHASAEDAAEFHMRTGGNPRAQFYALTKAEANAADMPALLDACALTPKPVFADLVDSALKVSGADVGGQRWLALMLALSRPVSTETLAAALEVDQAAVTAFAAGLDPGVKVSGGAIQFRDEDFEAYVRDRVEKADVVTAHDRLADMFLGSRVSDPDAAAHVADHLFSAGRLDELLELVLREDSPAGIADGFRREQVQARRLDLAACAAADSGDAAAAVQVAARGCDTASRFDTLSRMVESRLDLVARYADIDLLRSHALRQSRGQWLGPTLMRLAAALSRDPDRHAAARAELDRADAWLRRWMAGRESEARHWDLGPDDVAGAAEARYRLDGPAAAVAELRRWRPASFVLDAAAALAARLAGQVTPDEARDALRANRVPLAAQAPMLAHLASATTTPDPAWINEIAEALLAAEPGPPRPWQSMMLDGAIRYADRQAAAALARHWACELPTGRWSFVGAREEGTAILRCHVAAAALTGSDVAVDTLVPLSLQPQKTEKGGDNDPRAHDRAEWIEAVAPIAVAATLAVSAAIGAVNSDDVEALIDQGLADRTKRAEHRWFTYDRSYRTWATLVAEAAIDTHAPAAVLDRLADTAPRLVRDGAPELWLELAETFIRHGEHTDRAADLCARAAHHADTGAHSAQDRLDIIGRSAEIAAAIAPDLGRDLFIKAVDTATGINDDAARLLAVHADLACRAAIPASDRAGVAGSLVRAAEAVAPYVTDSEVIPYPAIAGAAAHLHPTTGLAAASRWDDEDRVGLVSTLPTALAGAVDNGNVPAWQALALDHLIEYDWRRLDYQIDMAHRMCATGASGVTAARVAVVRAADWLRCHVAAREQPGLARRLLDASATDGLGGNIRSSLDPLCAFGEDQDGTRTSVSARWDSGELPADVKALLIDPASRGWATLAEDVAALDKAHVYSEQLTSFIASVVAAAAPGQRIDALAAVAALPDHRAGTVVAVLADCLGNWHNRPGVAAWAKDALPGLLAGGLQDLAWQQDTDRLLSQLRAFADDDTIRSAVLRALPEARPQLTAFGWQNIAALLGRLCGPADAAAALLGLLGDRVQGADAGIAAEPTDPGGPIPAVLWSAFGHPRREIRWRAAHAVRDLLAHPDPTATALLAAALVRCLDREDAGAFRDPSLHFYRLSAAAGLLVALHRVATERPALLAPHLADLVRHATSHDLPHAQIRELARQTALAVVGPGDPQADALKFANQPTCCRIRREHNHAGNDRRVSGDHRYDFDPMDTLPYWYAPLARVFDVPLDTVAELAEAWILDRWGLGKDDWMADARELRDQRSWMRTNHRHGSIPPEENLQLYMEYHAMMAAAGELIDTGQSICVENWDARDPWGYWLFPHLPATPLWLADLRTPVPPEPALFSQPPTLDGSWDMPDPGEHDHAFCLRDGRLPDDVLVAASMTLYRRGGYESTCIRSALVRQDYAEDLQRALAAASNPTDWKLPDEGEERFEVTHGAFELRGWLVDPPSQPDSLDEHDPYAQGLYRALSMPGRAFRSHARTAADQAGFTLTAQDGAVVARGEQWADPDPDNDYDRGTAVRSSGYRVLVQRTALLRYLTDTSTSLIVEVQLGRHRSDTASEGYRTPASRMYLIHGDGRVTAR